MNRSAAEMLDEARQLTRRYQREEDPQERLAIAHRQRAIGRDLVSSLRLRVEGGLRARDETVQSESKRLTQTRDDLVQLLHGLGETPDRRPVLSSKKAAEAPAPVDESVPAGPEAADPITPAHESTPAEPTLGDFTVAHETDPAVDAITPVDDSPHVEIPLGRCPHCGANEAVHTQLVRQTWFRRALATVRTRHLVHEFWQAKCHRCARVWLIENEPR